MLCLADGTDAPSCDNLLLVWCTRFLLFVDIILTLYRCPGMFNALTGLGGGGQVNADIANNANIALYAVTSVVSFFGGTICNVIGPRVALAFGGTG